MDSAQSESITRLDVTDGSKHITQVHDRSEEIGEGAEFRLGLTG